MSRPAVFKMVICGFLGVLLCGWLLRPEVSVEEQLKFCRRAIDRRDLPQAEALLSEIFRLAPDHPRGRLLSAVLAAERADFESAVEQCARVSPADPEAFADALLMGSGICLEQLGRVEQSEQLLQHLLNRQPDHTAANQQMVVCLSLQGRAWDLIPFQIAVLKARPETATRIQLLMQGELVYPDEKELRRLRELNPDSAGLILGEAHLAFLRNDLVAAEHSCRRACALDPALTEAQAELARILLLTGDMKALESWRQSLPESSLQHPFVLNALGQIEFRSARFDAAACCFRDSLRIDPNSVSANFLLGQCLVKLHQVPAAEPFLARSASLERYQRLLEGSAASPSNVDPDRFDEFLETARTARELAESLGLIWEAWAWTQIAAEAPEPPAWVADSAIRLKQQLADLPRTRTQPGRNPAETLDLPGLSFPDRSQAAPVVAPDSGLSPTVSETIHSVVHFTDRAQEVGLIFTFDNGLPKPRLRQVHPWDFTGGGAGVIDLDADGWPDLCFPQAGDLLRSDRTAAAKTDAFFRNVRGLRFVEVTDRVAPERADYSQGIASGDLNQDGFPDLLIAALGPKRLLQNNGDGTFTDISPSVPGDASRWTTSCLICDLNQDAAPDLYFVNYLSGDILTRLCSQGDRQFGGCAPQDFPGAQDQVFLSRQDGTFEEVTETSGIVQPNGKGLGIAAGDFNADHRLDLFIANDGVPNFLFLNTTPEQSADLSFQESGLVNGVAVNGAGKAEACMGIAAEDLDGDGRLDLFVTNFLHETNTLYRAATPDGLYEDATSVSGLGPPSVQMLGFGTQAVDAELDGWPDLAVTNGHVDSYSGKTVPYRMPTQYFRNRGQLQFQEIPGSDIGEWFQQSALGRSMTRLDWNGDGADDLVVTRLDEPAGLLVNTTSDRGHFLKLRLIATRSNRDAIGAVVRVHAANRQLVRFLSAGDGYLASNERTMTFGLGTADQIIELNVTWPSGSSEICSMVPVDAVCVLIEGRGVLHREIR